MAFPQVASVSSSSEATNATLHDVLMPSGISAGDLLLAFAFIDGDVNPTLTGFTLVVRQQMNGSDDLTLMVWYKFATGAETNITYTTGTSQVSYNRVYRITGAHASTAPEGVGAESADAGGATNPASLNPTNWGTEDTLWFSASVLQDSTSFTGYPTGYNLYQFTDTTGGGDGVGVAIAAKENAAASEDPDIGFGNTGLEWAAVTVAVRPADAGIVPALPPVNEGDPFDFMPQPRRKKTTVGRGGHLVEWFEPLFGDPEIITADKFACEFPAVMRKSRWRPHAEYSLTDVPVPPDVVVHGWEFDVQQLQLRYLRYRNRHLYGMFETPQLQDPLTLGYLAILGTTTIEPSRYGASRVMPRYEGESGLNIEGE